MANKTRRFKITIPEDVSEFTLDILEDGSEPKAAVLEYLATLLIIEPIEEDEKIPATA